MTQKQLRGKDYLKKLNILEEKTLKNCLFKLLEKHLTMVVNPFNPRI